jgi:hypothetical protein
MIRGMLLLLATTAIALPVNDAQWSSITDSAIDDQRAQDNRGGGEDHRAG